MDGFRSEYTAGEAFCRCKGDPIGHFEFGGKVGEGGCKKVKMTHNSVQI